VRPGRAELRARARRSRTLGELRDGLTWTFHLRAGLQWSNGEPLTADDFVQSWRRNLAPAFASAYAYLLFPIKNAEAFNAGKVTDAAALGLAAPDARTVVITLERPTPYLPVLTAATPWYPVNPRVVAKFGALTDRSSAWTRPGNLVGNGPFVLKEWTPGSRLVVDKNPRYWDAAAVRLNSIVFYPIENPDVEERNFRAGQLHLTNNLRSPRFPPTATEPTPRACAPTSSSRFTSSASTSPSRRSTTRSCAALSHWRSTATPSRAACCTARVRRPITSCHHRPAVMIRGRMSPPNSTKPAACSPPPDTRVAPACRSSSCRFRNDELQPKIVEAVQAMWQRELGVRVSIAVLEQKVSIANQQALDYTIGVNGWVADFADPATFLDLFVTGGGNNWTGWGDPTYDRLIAAAARTADPKARAELFQQAEAILLEQAPVAPLVFGARNYLIAPSVKGWEPAPVGIYQYKKVYLQGP